MQTPWSNSFARAVSVVAKNLLPLLVAAGAWAADSQPPGMDYLSLQPLELGRAQDGVVSVGDRVELKAPGLPASVKSAEAADTSKPLKSEGFLVEVDAANQRIFAVPVKSGQLTLPPLLFKGEGDKPVARTLKLALEVTSAINPDDPKAKEPEPARPPVGLPFPLIVIILASVLGLALAALIAYFVVRYVRELKRRRALKPAGPPKTEDELALETLEKIAKKDDPANGKFKPHYFGVSETLKMYFGRRYDFDAQESTSRELLYLLERNALFGEELLGKVKELFEKLDMVKFTDHIPEREEARYVLEEARSLIVKTKRPPTVLQQGGAK